MQCADIESYRNRMNHREEEVIREVRERGGGGWRGQLQFSTFTAARSECNIVGHNAIHVALSSNLCSANMSSLILFPKTFVLYLYAPFVCQLITSSMSPPSFEPLYCLNLSFIDKYVYNLWMLLPSDWHVNLDLTLYVSSLAFFCHQMH